MKKLFSCLLIIVLVLCSTGTVTAQEDGILFERWSYYRSEKVLEKLPGTFEATVNLSEFTNTDEPSVILGSYMTSGTSGFMFGVDENGHPFLTIAGENSGAKTATFESVGLFTGRWTHLLITWDQETDQVRCYVNGENVDSTFVYFPTDVTLHYPLCLGSSHRGLNDHYFKGRIKNAAVYDGAMTHDFLATLGATPFQKEGMMAGYDLSAGGTPETVPDISRQGFDMRHQDFWADNYKSPKRYDYSFAVLGDTQWLTMANPDKLSNMFNWIGEHKDDKKIQYLFTLGDLTNKSGDTEFSNYKSCIDQLEIETGLPYSIVRGNHDTVAKFDKYFPYRSYNHVIDGSYDETMLNTYKCFEVGRTKYMSLVLDYSITDEELEWANQVVAQHPDRNVIVSTHSYLSAHGERGEYVDHDQFNCGQDIWDKLVRKHENIVLVLCGHVTSGDLVAVNQDTGDHGNTVTQLMTNPQRADHHLDGVGIVTMLYFSKGGRRMQVETYSTDRDAYFIEENQFTLELDLLDNGPSPWVWVAAAGALLLVAAGIVVLVLLRKRKMN